MFALTLLKTNYLDKAFCHELESIKARITSFPHSSLICGPKGIKKGGFALKVAQLLLDDSNKVIDGVHPDLHLYYPESANGSYTIDQIRKIQEDCICTPYEASCHVFILHQAEGLTTQASNAFLKTLEEPPSNVFFLLITSSPYKLLPTVLSRLVKLELKAPSDEIVNDEIQELDLGPYRFMIGNGIDQAKDLAFYKPYLDDVLVLLNGCINQDFIFFRKFLDKIDQDESFEFLKFLPFFEALLCDRYAFLFGVSKNNLAWKNTSSSDLSYKQMRGNLKKLEEAIRSYVKVSFALEQFFFSLEKS